MWTRPLRSQASCLVPPPIDVDVRFTPDAKLLVQTACGFAHVFAVKSGRDLRTLGGPTDPIGEEDAEAVVSPDGRVLAVTGEWSDLRLLDVQTGAEIEHGFPPNARYAPFPIAFSGNGRLLATASGRRTLVSSVPSGAVVGKPVPGRVLALSPRGEVAVAVRAGAGSLWIVSRNRPIGRELAVANVVRAAFAASGRRLAVSSEDGDVYAWRLTSRWCSRGLIRLAHDGVVGLRFDPSGELLASAGADGTVRLWDVTARLPLVHRLDSTGSYEVAFSPDGRRLMANGDDGTVLWPSTPTGTVGAPQFPGGVGYDIEFSPDGSLVASGLQDPGAVALWEVDAGQARTRIATGDYVVDDVAFSPDGRTVAASGENGVRFFDVETGRPVGKRLAPAFEPIAFGPDGHPLVSGSYSEDGISIENRTLRFWDVEKRTPLPVSSPGAELTDFAFSPDGKTLAVAEEDGNVGLWDVERRTLIDRFGADRSLAVECCDSVNAVAFSPDDSTLATAVGNTIGLWNTSVRAPLGDPVPVPAGIDRLWDINVLADGRMVAAAGWGGVFLVEPLLVSRDLGEWHRLCWIANRNLTELEWGRYLSGEPYRETCAGA